VIDARLPAPARPPHLCPVSCVRGRSGFGSQSQLRLALLPLRKYRLAAKAKFLIGESRRGRGAPRGLPLAHIATIRRQRVLLLVSEGTRRVSCFLNARRKGDLLQAPTWPSPSRSSLSKASASAFGGVYWWPAVRFGLSPPTSPPLRSSTWSLHRRSFRWIMLAARDGKSGKFGKWAFSLGQHR
jgi:hypothetical protein